MDIALWVFRMHPRLRMSDAGFGAWTTAEASFRRDVFLALEAEFAVHPTRIAYYQDLVPRPSELVSVSASFRRRVEMVDLEEQDEMYIGAIGFVIAGQFVLKAEEVSFVVRFS